MCLLLPRTRSELPCGWYYLQQTQTNMWNDKGNLFSVERTSRVTNTRFKCSLSFDTASIKVSWFKKQKVFLHQRSSRSNVPPRAPPHTFQPSFLYFINNKKRFCHHARDEMEVLLHSTLLNLIHPSPLHSSTRSFPSLPIITSLFRLGEKKALETSQGERSSKGHICQLHTKPAIVSQLISLDHPQ